MCQTIHQKYLLYSSFSYLSMHINYTIKATKANPSKKKMNFGEKDNKLMKWQRKYQMSKVKIKSWKKKTTISGKLGNCYNRIFNMNLHFFLCTHFS